MSKSYETGFSIVSSIGSFFGSVTDSVIEAGCEVGEFFANGAAAAIDFGAGMSDAVAGDDLVAETNAVLAEADRILGKSRK